MRIGRRVLNRVRDVGNVGRSRRRSTGRTIWLARFRRERKTIARSTGSHDTTEAREKVRGVQRPSPARGKGRAKELARPAILEGASVPGHSEVMRALLTPALVGVDLLRDRPYGQSLSASTSDECAEYQSHAS